MDSFRQQVSAQIARKLQAQRHQSRIIWSGLGMMGMIGWSVTVPTLLGALAGAWLDQHHPAGHSWTLTLLLSGLVLGCCNAWHWAAREDKEIQPPPGAGDD